MNPKTNRDLMVEHAKDSFVEQLKGVLAYGASLLDCRDLEKLTQETVSEMLSFLRAISVTPNEKQGKISK